MILLQLRVSENVKSYVRIVRLRVGRYFADEIIEIHAILS